ncbi:MAG: hypothetical protein JJU36_06215 [Phycisphaeraceae bacterium]|nr:hypothetical protein [Phycisphaeraceae bacterium]
MMKRSILLVGVACSALTLGGCGEDAEFSELRQVRAEFMQALERADRIQQGLDGMTVEAQQGPDQWRYEQLSDLRGTFESLATRGPVNQQLQSAIILARIDVRISYLKAERAMEPWSRMAGLSADLGEAMSEFHDTARREQLARTVIVPVDERTNVEALREARSRVDDDHRLTLRQQIATTRETIDDLESTRTRTMRQAADLRDQAFTLQGAERLETENRAAALMLEADKAAARVTYERARMRTLEEQIEADENAYELIERILNTPPIVFRMPDTTFRSRVGRELTPEERSREAGRILRDALSNIENVFYANFQREYDAIDALLERAIELLDQAASRAERTPQVREEMLAIRIERVNFAADHLVKSGQIRRQLSILDQWAEGADYELGALAEEITTKAATAREQYQRYVTRAGRVLEEARNFAADLPSTDRATDLRQRLDVLSQIIQEKTGQD